MDQNEYFIAFHAKLGFFLSDNNYEIARRFNSLDEIKSVCEKRLLSYQDLSITLIKEQRFVVQEGEK